MRKKHDSSLDKGHHFVLAPLGGIGPYFRSGELVSFTPWHVLDAAPMNSRGHWLGRRVQGVCEIALREALRLARAAIGAYGVQIGKLGCDRGSRYKEQGS